MEGESGSAELTPVLCVRVVFVFVCACVCVRARARTCAHMCARALHPA